MTDTSTRVTAPREFTITRMFDAPRELVWRAWTEPAELARWIGPHGFTTPPETVRMDLRPGGTLRFTMVRDADDAEYPTLMAFQEVTAPERLVFHWCDPERGVDDPDRQVVTVVLVESAGRTELRFRQSGVMTGAGQEEMRGGWAETFAKLAETLPAAAGKVD